MVIQNSLIIQAPLEVVWRITVEIENWPHWTPTVTRLTRLDTGPLRLGSQARIEQPGLPAAVWTVTQLEPNRCFAWETRVRGLHMLGRHLLQEEGPATRNTLELELGGWAGRLFGPLLRSRIAASLRQENAGLQRAAES